MCLFRTEPGYDLMVQGPDQPAQGWIAPLTGIIETDWAPYTFTMNWMFTRPGQVVRFEAGEPFCHFFPVQARRDRGFPRESRASRTIIEWRAAKASSVLRQTLPALIAVRYSQCRDLQTLLSRRWTREERSQNRRSQDAGAVEAVYALITASRSSPDRPPRRDRRASTYRRDWMCRLRQSCAGFAA